MPIKTILLILLFLSGCAPRWAHRTGVDDYTFNRDFAECDMSAQQAKYQAARDMRGNPFGGIAMIAAYDNAFDNCMYIKGYYKHKEAAP